MNIDDLIVEVRDGNLNRVGKILPTDLVGFNAVLRFNNVGTWEIPELPDSHPLCAVLRSPGSGIIVTGPDGVILSGPTISAINSVESGKGSGTWKISGVDDSVILGERLAYPTPTTADVTEQTSAYDTREGVASTVMLGYVSANLEDGVAPVERAIPYLSVGSDPLVGSTVKKSARFEILGELLSELASIDSLGFDIRQNGGVLEFNVFEPTDRSLEIRMDVANNTLSRTEYAYGRPNATLAIVAGQGAGTDRQFVEVTTTESENAETLWERRIETFIDQRNTSDATELEQAGLEKLATDGITVTSIDVVPSSDVTMVYGVDFNLGDRVGVTVGSQEVSAIVTTVSLSIQSDGVRVGATVGDPTGVDFEALTAKKSSDTQRRVNSLERKESGAGGGGITQPVNSLQWNTAFTGGSTAPGMIAWDPDNETFQFMLDAHVTLQMGQEHVVRVKNNSGSTAIPEFRVVMFAGSTGDTVKVSPAVTDGTVSSDYIVGITTEEIPADGFGFVTQFGFINKINTSAWTLGTILYPDASNPGQLTATIPTAPALKIPIAAVTRSHATTGRVLVRTIPGHNLGGLHDVEVSSLSAGQVLTRNSSNNAWINQQATPAGVISQFAGSSAPVGYLLCEGQAISRTTYAGLFAVIGTTYGAGNGSTTFNLPDLRTRIPAGKNVSGTFGTLGSTGGTEQFQLGVANLPSHTHTFSATTSDAGAHTHTYSGTTSTTGAHQHNIFIGGTVLAYGNSAAGFGGGAGVMFGGNNGFLAGTNGDHAHTFSGTTSGASTNHSHTVSGTTGGGSGTANSFSLLQPYIVLNYIIKF
jgi:microcystin-dependent protein